MRAFTRLVDALGPELSAQLPSPKLKAAFVHSLHVELYGPDSAVLLSPHAFQQAILRLALLLSAPPTESTTLIARVPTKLGADRNRAIAAAMRQVRTRPPAL